jgi:hypothetical protein
MKIRNGFVSNSSSASFVVAVKSYTPCPTCGRRDDSFLDLIEKIGRNADCEQTELTARGSDAVWKRWESNEMLSVIPEHRKLYDMIFGKMLEAEEKGYEVGEIEVSYGDETTENLMRDMERRKTLVKLWSDHYTVKIDKIEL